MSKPEHQTGGLEETSPDKIRNARFSTAFRGYDTAEVREFLNRVADAIAASPKYVLQAGAPGAGSIIAATPATRGPVDTSDTTTGSTQPAASADDALTHRQADEEREQARAESESILASARNEAHAIVARANDDAARIILRARAESRGKPSADTMAAVEAALAESPGDPALAKEQARIMISEAKAVRERILTDLAKRRRVAHVQLEQLRVAREKLLESFRDARRVADDASRDLSTAEVEARLAAETAGRRVGAEDLPSVSELEAELFSGRSMLGSPGSSWRSPGIAPVPPVHGSDPADSDGPEPGAIASEREEPGAEELSAVVVSPTPGARPDRAVSEVAVAGDADALTGHGGHAGSGRLANVDDLFARLRAEREQAAAEAHVYLDGGDPAMPGSPTATAKPTAGATALADPTIIELDRADPPAEIREIPAADGTGPALDSTTGGDPFDAAAFDPETPGAFSLAPGSAVDVVREESEQFVFVSGPLQAQCARAIKRLLQDEQSAALAALRTARSRVALEDLLGERADHEQRLRTTVGSFLIDAYRAGADGANRTGDAEAVGGRLDELGSVLAVDIADSIRTDVDAVLGTDADNRSLGETIADIYRRWSSDRLHAMSSEQLRTAFILGWQG